MSDRSDEVARLFAALEEDNLDNLRILLATNVDVNARDSKGDTALHVAASRGRSEAIELLLAHGANIEAQDDNNRTPLHLCRRERSSGRGRTVAGTRCGHRGAG